MNDSQTIKFYLNKGKGRTKKIVWQTSMYQKNKKNLCISFINFMLKHKLCGFDNGQKGIFFLSV